MKTSIKLILTAAAIGTLGMGGLAKLVNATQTQSPVAAMPTAQVTEKSDGDGEANPATEVPETALKSQLQAANPSQQTGTSDGDGEIKDDAKEQQESQKLQSFAKITARQAQQSAEASVKGTASNVKLENENGNLVYAVAIGQNEVIVDAGNGKVLSTNTLNSENSEKTQPRSSIQVSGTTGDGDGETQDDG
ncbi:MAG: PepSY domain-containing protein [Phormidesmis sp. CAN_BIN44]|nr:PepSY domain-containing protein [Phormidesmis sp. CAN_BIN44]